MKDKLHIKNKGAMTTKVGRFFRRIVKEERGDFLQYVILAVLLTAACVATVIYISKTIQKQGAAAAAAAAGQTEDAKRLNEEAKAAAKQAETEGAKDRESFSDKK